MLTVFFQQRPAGKSGINPASTPWCAAFAMNMLKDHGWQRDGTADHIGIVEKVENGKVTTIEGNSSDSVKRNTYSLGDSKIDGYVVTNSKNRRR